MFLCTISAIHFPIFAGTTYFYRNILQDNRSNSKRRKNFALLLLHILSLFCANLSNQTNNKSGYRPVFGGREGFFEWTACFLIDFKCVKDECNSRRCKIEERRDARFIHITMNDSCSLYTNHARSKQKRRASGTGSNAYD